MKASRSQAVTIRNAIAKWSQAGLLDSQTAATLDQSIEVMSFDWKKLAKYSFWIALSCLFAAVTTLLADKALIELMMRIFKASDAVKSVGLALASVLLYVLGYRRRQKYPEKVFSVEAIFFAGVLTMAGSIIEFGNAVDASLSQFSNLILVSTLIYGALGFKLKSNLIWIFSILLLGGWVGMHTGNASGRGGFYLGMNYPLRFVVFGAVLLAATFFFEKKPLFAPLFKPSLAMALLYFFVSLWILSIFGNYGDISSWRTVRQIELFPWALLFAAGAGAAIWHGLRFENSMTKSYGVFFLLIGLYTRFFEHFWGGMHKAIFFSILAASFWYLGTHAEKIWNLGDRDSSSQ